MIYCSTEGKDDTPSKYRHERTSVSGYGGAAIRGICLVDIVPTYTQRRHGGSPSEATKAITAHLHWSFFIYVDLAANVISSCSGSSGYLEEEDIVRASCGNYKHSATMDLVLQEKDQEEERRISSSSLLLYSQTYIGNHFNLSTAWKNWAVDGVDV